MTEQPTSRHKQDSSVSSSSSPEHQDTLSKFLASARVVLVVLACIGAVILALPLAAIVEAERLVTHKKGGRFSRLLEEFAKP
jgi:ABC-type Fe3+ transport system permease subunit